MKTPVIYLVTNKITGQQYIGLTRFTAAKRWAQHIQKSKAKDTGSWFHRAIAKYGAEGFEVSDFLSCLSVEHASSCERMAVQQIAPAYNRTNGGEFTVGKRVAPEVVQRIREANTGKKRTPEQNAAMSAIKKEWNARPEVRAAAIKRLAEARLLIDQEKRVALASEACRLRVWSDESRAKLSASCMGRRYGQDVIDRMREKKKKPVECIDLNCTFDSVLDAAEATGIYFSNISKVCLGKHKTAGGMKFRFAQGERHR